MDSHGSASPTSPAKGATSRSASGDVTRRWQTEHRIVGFRDVEQLADGSWSAVHKSTGQTVTAPTFEQLEKVEAPMTRILHAWGVRS
ncbi:hypothetical protein [Nonomuraea sp. B19D2]|uniref:hypothetical protein n=1 Tax=Nonomuraea sp. B19D2 TaxID=3159561 RepID=UPI0032DBC2A2